MYPSGSGGIIHLSKMGLGLAALSFLAFIFFEVVAFVQTNDVYNKYANLKESPTTWLLHDTSPFNANQTPP